MRNFKKIALAGLALVLTVTVMLCIYTYPYFYGTSYYYQDAEVRKNLSGELDFLISGSSHGFRAFVPEIIDDGLGCYSYNLACAMQTMEGRYHLLKKEIARNDIKTVVLELSYNALTRDRYAEGPEGDIYQLGRLDGPLERISYFFTAFYPKEYGKLYHDTLDRASRAWEDFSNDSNPIPQQTETKGYIPLDPVNQTIDPASVSELYYSKSLNTEINPQNLEYFTKCMDLCIENDIRVILIVTPITDKSIIQYQGFDTVKQWYEDFAEKYNCEFYDFNLLKTKIADYPSDTAFFDGTHLSAAGADTFSRQFCEVIKLVDSGKDVSDMFYDNYSDTTDIIIESVLQ